MLLSIIVSVFAALLFIGVVLVIIYDNGDTGYKLAWLLLITFLPVVGIILYLLVGINYRHHRFFNRRHQEAFDKFAAESDAKVTGLLGKGADLSSLDERFRPLAGMFLKGSDIYNLSEGNSFEIITSGKRKYDLLLEDIRNARLSIHLEYFHFGNDKGGQDVRNLLEQKAREGVEVRFLNENIANFPIPSSYYDSMRKSGIEVVRFTNPKKGLLSLPMRLNYRNHRKTVVIDGRIGYTGGMNINNHYFFQWRDTHLRIEGPAVAALQTSFIDSWLTSGGSIKLPLPEYFSDAPAGPAEGPGKFSGKIMQIVTDEPTREYPLIQMGYEWVLQNARDYIYLQTPYLVPPESVLRGLKSAVLRGVDVRLMLPEKVDTLLMGAANKAYYGECLEAGIRIFERGGEFIHSKTLVCDDYLSQIGTANIDVRSFSINFEENAYIYDRQAALANKEIFMSDLALSREVTLEEWNRRKWHQNIGPRIMRLFSGVL